MEITDLMIGDWVRLKDDYLSYEESCMKISFLSTSAICALRCKGTNTPIGLKNSDENWMCPVFEDDIEPIPITPEILEKNGYSYNETRDVWELIPNDGFGICRDEDDNCFYFCLGIFDAFNSYSDITYHYITRVEYVHELQHALKLCKIEKDIVL